MRYTIDDLIHDLNEKMRLDHIQEKYKDSNIDLKALEPETAKKFKVAYDQYCNVKYKEGENPPIHEDIARKK